jgi:hypothetical protein
MKTAREIAEEIFYSPATNGKAEQSILNGEKLIEEYAKGYKKFMCAKGAEDRCKEQCFTCSEDEACDFKNLNKAHVMRSVCDHSLPYFDKENFWRCEKCGEILT